jgi:type II secretory pathway component GspD/PulD (secretin)
MSTGNSLKIALLSITLIILAISFGQSEPGKGAQSEVTNGHAAEINVSQTDEHSNGYFDKKADQRLRRIVKILRTSDKAQVNQYVPVAFELKHVNPYAVIRFIRRVIEVEEGNWWTFVAPDHGSGRLLVNVPIWQVEPIKELVAIIDRPQLTSSDGSERVYYHLKHRDPGDPGFIDAVEAYMTGTGDVMSDRPAGAIFLEDAPSGVERALEKIKQELDVPTKQVIVRAKIYEIDLNNDGTIGLDFHAWKNGPGRSLFAFGSFVENAKTNRLDTNGVDGVGIPIFSPGVDVYGLPRHRFNNAGYNIAYYYDVPSAFFDFLVTKGRARVLTAPRTIVMNTETAEFSTGEEILFYRVQNGASAVAGVRPENMLLDPNGDNVNFPDNRTVTGQTMPRAVTEVADAGVALNLTPVIAEESINLNINIALVSHLGFDNSGVPLLHTREVHTDVRANPGSEYIIGGLTRTRAIQTTRKVPVLGSFPVLGWLFGGEITTAKKTLLAIAVSADVVEDFSGMGNEEIEMVERVNSATMNSVTLPEENIGFDMMLMDE